MANTEREIVQPHLVWDCDPFDVPVSRIDELDSDPRWIFHPRNFWHPQENLWSYSDLFPALQIAHLILYDNRSLPFWAALMKAKPVLPTKVYESQTYELTIKKQLNDVERLEVHGWLRKLSSNIKFDPSPTPDTTAGQTSTTKFRDLAGKSVGQGGTIRIHREYLTYAAYFSSNPTTIQARLFYAKLAIVICHEVAHAAEMFALNGGIPYLHGENLAEFGFAYENYLFGGISEHHRDVYLSQNELNALQKGDPKCEVRYLLRSWPSQSFYDSYDYNYSKIAVKGPMDVLTTVHGFSAAELLKFATASFWDGLAADGDVKDFHIRKSPDGATYRYHKRWEHRVGEFSKEEFDRVAVWLNNRALLYHHKASLHPAFSKNVASIIVEQCRKLKIAPNNEKHPLFWTTLLGVTPPFQLPPHSQPQDARTPDPDSLPNHVTLSTRRDDAPEQHVVPTKSDIVNILTKIYGRK